MAEIEAYKGSSICQHHTDRSGKAEKIMTTILKGGGGEHSLIRAMCGLKGMGFSYVLVINRVSILFLSRVWYLHSDLELGMFLKRSYFFFIINNCQQKLFKTYV